MASRTGTRVKPKTASARPAGRDTRAQAHAPVGVEVVAIHVPEGVQRAPRVAVDVALPGGVRFRAIASRRRGGAIGVALPLTRDGEPALFLPSDLQAQVEEEVRQAVQGHRAAWDRLRVPASERQGQAITPGANAGTGATVNKAFSG